MGPAVFPREVLRGFRAGARFAPPKCGSTRSFPFAAFATGFGFRRVAMVCLPQPSAIAGEAPRRAFAPRGYALRIYPGLRVELSTLSYLAGNHSSSWRELGLL